MSKQVIYFHHLSVLQLLGITLLTFSIIGSGLYVMFYQDRQDLGLLLICLGSILSSIPNLIILFKKHFFSWSTKGIIIKLNGVKTASISYRQIKDFEWKDPILTFQSRGKSYHYDLYSYAEQDVQKVIRIIKEGINQ